MTKLKKQPITLCGVRLLFCRLSFLQEWENIDRIRTESYLAVHRIEVDMYIIVGLGNPDRQYRNTRHNIGFDVIDAIAEKNDITLGEKKHKAVIGKGYVAGQKAVLVKPITYMNLSGESVRSVIDFYKVDEKSELIVISDDVSLDVGQIRIRKRGSDGGHNGLKNIILHLGHDSFIRVRMPPSACRC